MKPLALIGAGGHGKVVAGIGQLLGFEMAGFFDDGKPPGFLARGLPVLGDVSLAFENLDQYQFVVSIGHNPTRRLIYLKLREAGAELVTLVHPSAVIDSTSQLGLGTVVMAGAVVNVDSRVGENCILNTCCSLDHDGWLGDHVHLCPGVHLAGTCRVEEGCMLGTGATVIPGIRLGPDTVLGAGAVLTRSITGGTWVGVPARLL